MNKTCTFSSGWRSWRAAKVARHHCGRIWIGGEIESAVLRFAIARFAGLAQFAAMKPPIMYLRDGASEPPAGPDQLVGQKHPPGIVAFGDRARDDIAGHRGGVQPVAAEAAGEPYLWHQFADLRHAMKGIT